MRFCERIWIHKTLEDVRSSQTLERIRKVL